MNVYSCPHVGVWLCVFEIFLGDSLSGLYIQSLLWSAHACMGDCESVSIISYTFFILVTWLLQVSSCKSAKVLSAQASVLSVQMLCPIVSTNASEYMRGTLSCPGMNYIRGPAGWYRTSLNVSQLSTSECIKNLRCLAFAVSHAHNRDMKVPRVRTSTRSHHSLYYVLHRPSTSPHCIFVYCSQSCILCWMNTCFLAKGTGLNKSRDSWVMISTFHDLQDPFPCIRQHNFRTFFSLQQRLTIFYDSALQFGGNNSMAQLQKHGVLAECPKKLNDVETNYM